MIRIDLLKLKYDMVYRTKDRATAQTAFEALKTNATAPPVTK